MPPAKPRKEGEDLVEIFVGMQRSPKGYVAYTAKAVNGKVVERKLHGPPQPKELTAAILKMVTFRTLINPEMKIANLNEYEWS